MSHVNHSRATITMPSMNGVSIKYSMQRQNSEQGKVLQLEAVKTKLYK